MVDAISYSAFRTQLASTLDKVNDDHKPMMITRQNGKPVGTINMALAKLDNVIS